MKINNKMDDESFFYPFFFVNLLLFKIDEPFIHRCCVATNLQFEK